MHRMKQIMTRPIAYTYSDKFSLSRDEVFNATFKPPQKIVTPYCTFYSDGTLLIKKCFQWSANFPAVNTNNTLPASLFHDCGYQLIKDGYLPREPYRELFDIGLRDILLECNILDARAWAWYRAVQIGGDEALDSPRPKVRYAPRDPSTVPNINLHKGLI